MKTTKEQDLVMLKELTSIFEMEMDCDGYEIEQKDDVPYHFIIKDYEGCGWEYVHGAKRLIEYYFDCCITDKDNNDITDAHSIHVEARFTYYTEDDIQVMDIKFEVTNR